MRHYSAALRKVSPHARLDIPGLLLATAGFASVVYGIGEAASKGWDSFTVLGFASFGALCLIALVFVELRADAPLLDMRLFKDWNFVGANLITWAMQIALFGALFLVPLFLQNLRGLNAMQTGFVLLPSSLATMVALPISGILVDRVGPKWSIVVGLSALTFASYLLSHITLATPIWLLQLWLIGRSVGLGFAIQPVNVIALGNVPIAKLSRASAFYNVLRQVASAFTTSFLATYVQNSTTPHYSHLVERVTPLSPTGIFMSQAIAGLIARGYSAIQAQAMVARQVVGQIRLQATVMGFHDALVLIAFFTGAAIILALFVGTPPKRAGVPMLAE